MYARAAGDHGPAGGPRSTRMRGHPAAVVLWAAPGARVCAARWDASRSRSTRMRGPLGCSRSRSTRMRGRRPLDERRQGAAGRRSVHCCEGPSGRRLVSEGRRSGPMVLVVGWRWAAGVRGAWLSASASAPEPGPPHSSREGGGGAAPWRRSATEAAAHKERSAAHKIRAVGRAQRANVPLRKIRAVPAHKERSVPLKRANVPLARSGRCPRNVPGRPSCYTMLICTSAN